jgi:hypothetical protein
MNLKSESKRLLSRRRSERNKTMYRQHILSIFFCSKRICFGETPDLFVFRLQNRVARLLTYIPKIQICLHLGGPLNGKCWYILWSLGVCRLRQFPNFVSNWHSLGSFGILFPVFWYVCTKKNLAALLQKKAKQAFPFRTEQKNDSVFTMFRFKVTNFYRKRNFDVSILKMVRKDRIESIGCCILCKQGPMLWFSKHFRRKT